MKIFKCLITGDEVLADTFKMELKDNCYYVVEGKMTTVSNKIDEALLGSNPSAEEQDEGTDDSAVSGVDVVINHKLMEIQMDKKSFKTYSQKFCKSALAKLQEKEAEGVVPKGQAEAFKSNAPAFFKMIMGNLDDYQLYGSEHFYDDDNGTLLYCKWEGETPKFYFMKDSVEEEKV